MAEFTPDDLEKGPVVLRDGGVFRYGPPDVTFQGVLRTSRRRRLGLGWVFAGGQWAATGIAIGGVLLNNARRRECFGLWLVSNGISLVYHLRARLWGLAVRDMVFSVLAVVGWFMWGR